MARYSAWEGAFRHSTGHSVANAKSGIGLVDVDDHPSGAVAEWRGGLEPITNFGDRIAPAEVPRSVEHLPHVIWPRQGLLDEVHVRLHDLHLFGADADHRVSGPNEHAAGRRSWLRNILQLEATVLVLRDLLHDAWLDTT